MKPTSHPRLMASLIWLSIVATCVPFAAGAESGAAKDRAEATATRTASTALKADPLDWPIWRGPEQNGISRETGLVDKFDPAGGPASNVIWASEELGGISTPIVMRGKLYTIVRADPGTTREGEKVVCVDAATGKKLWENRFNVFLSDVPAERVGWSNCAGDPTTGRIYAMGVCGYFQCLDGETGKTIWKHSLNEEYGLLSTYGGRTNTPVVFEDLVLISAVVIGWGEMSKPTHRFMAFNKDTGEMVWFNGTTPLPKDTTYSTPCLTVLKGQAAMVFGSGDGGVWAFQPRTGKPIWNFQFSMKGLNVSPLVAGDIVYDSQSEENFRDPTSMGSIAAINGAGSGDITKTGEVWHTDGMAGKSSPLLVDGRLYIFDEGGKLYVLNAATGAAVSRPVKLIGTIMRGSPLYADGKIYACTTSAWHVFQPTKEGVKTLQKFRLPPDDEVSGSPIVSHGRIYLPSARRLYCLGQKDQKPSATEQPAPPKEDPLGKDDKPAQVQVTPVEILLQPGQRQQFTVRLFNVRGQLLKKADAKFSLDGPGEIGPDGRYVAASAPAHSATTVTAKVGDLSGTARIRVVPPLPWRFDFNDIPLAAAMAGMKEGEPPITWIGSRYRNKIREIDGEKVMVKITTIPKGTRSQSWMGPVELHDYTIMADVRGADSGGKMPDIGLIGQRYTLDLMGASQQVQIRSWTPQLSRFSKTVPFEWKPDTWYVMKFRAAAENDKAVLKGKVWPRGEKEPDQWLIEAVDEQPNLVGSPGLFGNAGDAEIYVDNVIVTSNAPLAASAAK